MTERSNNKLNPIKYFYMCLLLPIRILNHSKVVSKWASTLISTLPLILFLILALMPLYRAFESMLEVGSLIIMAGLILLVYLWVFYAAGFLVFYFMNKIALQHPKSTSKLLHDYGVLASSTQFMLILLAALILILLNSAADITIVFVITIPSIVLVMFIYITFAIFIFGKYLVLEKNTQTVKWIVMFIIFQLLTAFIFTVLPFIILRFS